MLRGNMQYPKTQTLWKKEILPPKSWALRVTMPEPIQKMKNTLAKMTISCEGGADRLSIMLSWRHNSKGPHKSQFLSSRSVSSCCPDGLITYLILTHIFSKSRFNVTDTGSSRVPESVELPDWMSMVPLNDCASVVGSDDSPNSVIVNNSKWL